jgi:hypothetical protein
MNMSSNLNEYFQPLIEKPEKGWFDFIKGPIGPIGPIGPVGPAGPIGPIGSIGPMGPIGPLGPIGPRGIQGERGLQGIQGERGQKGEQGRKGDKGDRGNPGTAGPIGPIGPAGSIYKNYSQTDESSTLSKNTIVNGSLNVNGETKITNGRLQINSNGRSTTYGSANNGWSHFYTDAPRYYLNKEVTVDGPISSYANKNLELKAGHSKSPGIVVNNANGNVIIPGLLKVNRNDSHPWNPGWGNGVHTWDLKVDASADIASLGVRNNVNLQGPTVNYGNSQFKVGGENTKFYPVVFNTGHSWGRDGKFNISINRPEVHVDGQWKGSLQSEIEGHNTNWGHGSDYLIVRTRANREKYIADIAQDRTSTLVIVFLRGNTTYRWTTKGASLEFANPEGKLYQKGSGGSAATYNILDTIKSEFDHFSFEVNSLTGLSTEPRKLTVNGSVRSIAHDPDFSRGGQIAGIIDRTPNQQVRIGSVTGGVKPEGVQGEVSFLVNNSERMRLTNDAARINGQFCIGNTCINENQLKSLIK